MNNVRTQTTREKKRKTVSWKKGTRGESSRREKLSPPKFSQKQMQTSSSSFRWQSQSTAGVNHHPRRVFYTHRGLFTKWRARAHRDNQPHPLPGLSLIPILWHSPSTPKIRTRPFTAFQRASARRSTASFPVCRVFSPTHAATFISAAERASQALVFWVTCAYMRSRGDKANRYERLTLRARESRKLSAVPVIHFSTIRAR